MSPSWSATISIAGPIPPIPGKQVSFGTSGHRGTSSNSTFHRSTHSSPSRRRCVIIGRSRRSMGRSDDGEGYARAFRCGAAKRRSKCLPPMASKHQFRRITASRQRRRFRGRFLPTTVARKSQLADGIVITPSHNPPSDGGFKYNATNGGPADTDVTAWVQDRANAILRDGSRDVRRIPFETAIKKSTTHQTDFIGPYVKDLPSIVDLESIKSAKVKIGVDPLGGASLHYWEHDSVALQARSHDRESENRSDLFFHVRRS